MTRIVKASAVVDDRTRSPVFQQEEFPLVESSILKRHAVRGSSPSRTVAPVTIDQHRDELNRLLVQTSAAKDELASLTRQLSDLREELGAAQSLLEIEVDDADARTKLLHDLQEQARSESDQMLSLAREECDAIRETARIEGFKEGYTAGMEQAVGQFQEENEPQAQLLGQLIERLTAFEHQMVAENESNLINLVIAVAQKVLHKELSEDPGTLVNLLYEIVDENRRETYIKIFLAKDLLPVEAKASQEVRDLIAALGANVTVVSDDSIEPGSIIVETPKGISDVSLSTQMDNIAAALKEG